MKTKTDYLTSDDYWTMVIRPQRAWWDLRLGDLWRYRDLIRLMIWRDFVAVYKQTILGPLWHVIQPILTTIVFTVIFGRIARLPTDGLPPFLFYMAGTTVWGYFYSCLLSTSNTFTSNAAIFGKVYFPRLSIPVSIVISNLISFGIRLGIFVVFLIYFRLTTPTIHPNLWMLLLPVLSLIMAGLGLGVGIIISSLTTKYRDLQHLVGFSAQLLMYATPIIYPLSSVPEDWRWLLLINPLTPVVEMFRLGFLGTSAVEPVFLLYSLVFTIITLLIGVLAFNHVENTFMDTV
jgi:homopolymeric O-antigen transport system permease protein